MSDRILEVTRKTDDEILSRIYYYQEPNGNTYKKIVTNAYGEPTETTEYTYNSWNLLESAAVQKGNTKTDVTFKYDATNRRNGKITKIYENEKLKNSKTTEYIWYGDKVQYEEVTQNRAVTPSVNMWGMTGLAARNDDLFSSDAHGNTDAEYSGETTVKKYAYDAYGNAINDNGDDDNPYRYCGESYDEETGLYYLRARYYDTTIGRFMSEDPAQDGLNWYNYCGNNPVQCVDPSGMYVVTVRDGIYTDYVLPNVNTYSTGEYCDLRALASIGYAGVTWNSYYNEGICCLSFNKGDNRYEIQMRFDSLEEGTYAKVATKRNGEFVNSDDPVKNM